MLGVNNHVVMKAKGKNIRSHKKDVKVTYISSPMKVKTSASNFRALVQELTGQASNVAEVLMEPDYAAHDDDGVHKGSSTQHWSLEAHLPVSPWFKPDHYTHLYSRSSMEPLNGQLQYEF
ncbi:Sigma factor binding protein 1, chloroplastic, partial [Mucuna pruriens]